MFYSILFLIRDYLLQSVAVRIGFKKTSALRLNQCGVTRCRFNLLTCIVHPELGIMGPSSSVDPAAMVF